MIRVNANNTLKDQAWHTAALRAVHMCVGIGKQMWNPCQYAGLLATPARAFAYISLSFGGFQLGWVPNVLLNWWTNQRLVIFDYRMHCALARVKIDVHVSSLAQSKQHAVPFDCSDWLNWHAHKHHKRYNVL